MLFRQKWFTPVVTVIPENVDSCIGSRGYTVKVYGTLFCYLQYLVPWLESANKIYLLSVSQQ
jgi:hypothetical protein